MRSKLLQLREEILSRGDVAKIGLTVIFSFFFSHAQAFTDFSPWGIAFCMAVPYRYTLFAFAGSFLGYTLIGSVWGTGIYMAALLLSCCVKMIIRTKDTAFLLRSLFAFGSLLLGYVVQMLVLPVGLGTWVLHLSEAVLCGGMTYLFGLGITTVSQKKERTRLPVPQQAGIIFLWISLLLSLAGFSILQLNVAMILFSVCLIGAAVSIGSTAASVIGVLGVLALIVYDSSFMAPAGIMVIAAFFVGVFRPLGKTLQVFTFLIIGVLFGIFLGEQWMAPIHLAEMAVGMGLYLLLPRRTFDFVVTQFRAETFSSEKPFTNELASQLSFSAKTLLDLQAAIQEVSNRLDNITNSSMSVIYTKTAEQVCKPCPLHSFCWVTAYQDILLALQFCSKQLKENGQLTPENAPHFFRQKCTQYQNFVMAVNHNYEEYLTREQSARRISEARTVAIEQFSGISDMLIQMSHELSDVSELDRKAAMKVRGVLQDHGILTEEISCMVDRFSRMTVDVFLDAPLNQREQADITDEISDELDREFELPSMMTAAGKVKLSFFESASLRVEFSAVQSANQDQPHCGDSYDFFMDSKGYAHIVLSDGMGSGNHAAIDSTMTCATLKKLIQAGFGFESAFKLMNLSFFIKSREESISTVDVCTIDLYTGTARFCKAGACASFVLRGSRVVQVTTDSLPIGILQGIRYDTSQAQVQKGDVLVMLSDGALMGGSDWIAADLPLFRKNTAHEIASHLCEEAKRRWFDGHSDDLTVLVAKIR